MIKKSGELLKSFFANRLMICGIVSVVFIGILLRRIYVLQIVNGEEYLDTFTYRIQKDVEVPAPRGNIYDADGNALTYNDLAYNITIEDSTLLSSNETRNNMVSNLLDIIDRTGNTAVYDIPLTLDTDGNVIYDGSEYTILYFKQNVFSTDELSSRQKSMSAEDLYEYMRGDDLFEVSDEYDKQQTLRILSLRYDLYMKRYSKYISVVAATDVNEALVAAVRENSDILPGVTVEQDYTRKYINSKYFASITGYIGYVSQDDLSETDSSGEAVYSVTDKIGKTGIELYYESELRGEKGSQTLYVNSLGSVLETADTVEPVAGNDIYLTIDPDLQVYAYNRLEERIAGILLKNLYESEDETAESLASKIPIKEFYFALIDNNVISLSKLAKYDASTREKNFYKKFTNYSSRFLDDLDSIFATPKSELTDEYKEYISLIYDYMSDYGILVTTGIDFDDTFPAAWNKGTESLADLVHYCAGKDLVAIDLLNLPEGYIDSDEICSAVINYLKEHILKDEDFCKKVYYYMLANDVISGKEICLLLYDQGVLDIDNDYYALIQGEKSAYAFMYSKIYNLEITPAMLALPPCSGAYVMVDVSTGQVKALVSYPGYDANLIMNDDDYYLSLIGNSSSPLYNKATQMTLAPGSTFKAISAVAGLEEGVITGDSTIYDNVEYDKVEPHCFCWSKYGHGSVNVVTAIKESCNYFFYEVGYRLGENENGNLNDEQGIQRLAKYAKMFGMDETTGLEINETEPTVSDAGVVRSAIGQGNNLYTPANLARYYTAVANSGTLFDLTLTWKIVSPEGETVYEKAPYVERTLDSISDETWDLVHTGLYQVCNVSSYRKYMSNLPIVLAGKSGTSEESENLPEHSLFAGYAPYEDPEVAASLVIPNGHGSSNVLDLYADIMCHYFGYEYDSSYNAENRHADIPDEDIHGD
ncbi:MAG: hypothetical protein K5637_06970 [Lachnospiraceae bacterium]|nr:hypothetical protein [Lachnospiraceae bacterium]